MKKISIKELNDFDNDSGIDENKLQEFDQEVSNYLGNSMDEGAKSYQKFSKSENNFTKPYTSNYDMYYDKNYENNTQNLDNLAKFSTNYEKFYPTPRENTIGDDRYNKLEDSQKIDDQNKANELEFYIEENEKLTRKIVEYQKLNREWEVKVVNIKNVITDLEQRNVSYKEENEKLKEECEQHLFKLKLSNEKEKIHETNFKNLKDLQNEYETKLNEKVRQTR
jgi:hypothetical protein